MNKLPQIMIKITSPKKNNKSLRGLYSGVIIVSGYSYGIVLIKAFSLTVGIKASSQATDVKNPSITN